MRNESALAGGRVRRSDCVSAARWMPFEQSWPLRAAVGALVDGSKSRSSSWIAYTEHWSVAVYMPAKHLQIATAAPRWIRSPPVDVVAISKLPAWQVPDTTISRLIPLVRCGDDASGTSCGHRLETVLVSWTNIVREQHELALTRRFATSPPLCPMIDCTCHPRPEHCCM